MTDTAPPDGVRAAEIVASVCLATDLGMGFPTEHGFHATMVCDRLCDVLGVDDETRRQAYYVCLLTYSGCNADAALGSDLFGGSQTESIVPSMFGSRLERLGGVIGALAPLDVTPLGKVVETARRLPRALAVTTEHQTALCEVAQMIAQRLGLPREIHDLFTYLTERWDGKGILSRAAGAEIPLALRIALVARDATFQRWLHGDETATQIVADRAGHAFDPHIANRVAADASLMFSGLDDGGSVWDRVLAIEVEPWTTVPDDRVEPAMRAMGDFVDLLSPTLSGHSSGVATLADEAARLVGMDERSVATVRRAGLVHDLGRVAVHPRVWEKPGPLSADESEQVRLHPYHTERILSHAPVFADLIAPAGRHHEYLNGSGYPHSIHAADMSDTDRLLAAADAMHAMTETRRHRPALSGTDATKQLSAMAEQGLLDPRSVAAVVEASGREPPAIALPSGLTEREAQVLGLLARGLLTKQIATALGISPKTADTHIQNTYRKAGVSTRASATLFAMEHGLVPSGELPIPT